MFGSIVLRLFISSLCWTALYQSAQVEKACEKLETGMVLFNLTTKRKPEALTLILKSSLAELLLLGAHDAKPAAAGL